MSRRTVQTARQEENHPKENMHEGMDDKRKENERGMTDAKGHKIEASGRVKSQSSLFAEKAMNNSSSTRKESDFLDDANTQRPNKGTREQEEGKRDEAGAEQTSPVSQSKREREMFILHHEMSPSLLSAIRNFCSRGLLAAR